jgi:hypothetical protein
MLVEILNIVAPVFLVIAAGYVAVRSGITSAESIDRLIQFTINHAGGVHGKRMAASTWTRLYNV